MSGNDPKSGPKRDPTQDSIDEVGEETFPASDAPPFSGAHAGGPGEHGLRLLIDLPPDSPDVGYFRRALVRFDGHVAVTFADAAGDAFARALPEADVVVAQDLSDDQLAQAGRLRWLSSVAAGLEEIVTPALLARGVAVTNASGVHGPNIAEHVIRSVPRGTIEADETAVSASSRSARSCTQRSKNACPVSVSESRRVVRFRSRASRCASRSATARETEDTDTPRRAAAPAKLPASTTRAKAVRA